MSEEVILKDLKQVPDKYYDYTQILRNSKTPIVIDNGITVLITQICVIIIRNYIFRFVYV